MCVSRWVGRVWICGGLLCAAVFVAAEQRPRILEVNVDGAERRVRVGPYPAAEQYHIYRADSLDRPFTEETSGVLTGYDWLAPGLSDAQSGFYRLAVTTLPERSVMTATVLSRLAYGATPDDLERLAEIGPEAYIEEQLAPEKITEELAIDALSPSDPGWRYITVTGRGSSSKLYIYLTVPGEGYIDDVKLVRGTVPEVGPNLIRNGDFEAPLSTNDWVIAENLTESRIVTDVRRSGNGSLHLIATDAGSTGSSAIVQDKIQPSLSNSQEYTLSYWYLPSQTKPSSLTVRLSGRGIDSSSDTLKSKLVKGLAEIDDLQDWFMLRAIYSKRQLFEVLTQFVDNHFTTYYRKSRDYIDGRIRADLEGFIATEFEFRELSLWRDVLLNPNGTFYDLLKISVESPAMIIYLDTVSNKAGKPNENYARELMELFTMGVDNGYDQADIEEMSRAWTGWRVDKLPWAEKDNPFARAVANRNTDPGVWSLRFSRSRHDTGSKVIFPGKTVDARFGPPHAGRSYELKLPARGDTAGMRDGYNIIAHLADLPYTQEYISVKLCRLFVHEQFEHGIYDYTAAELSPEAALVRDCMKAWDTPAADGRKGNLRAVLRVIFASDLFRAQAAARQKVKTPFELVVSAVRGLYTETTDGPATVRPNPGRLDSALRTLGMRLFYREDPDGWSELGRDWINTSSLVHRMRFVQQLLSRNENQCDPVALLKLKIPASQWRDAEAVAGLFVELLFPGEGAANLALDRAAAVVYLNTNDAGSGSSPFSSLSPSSSAYDARVRSMVAMLMGLPRFQEQ